LPSLLAIAIKNYKDSLAMAQKINDQAGEAIANTLGQKK
jgi:hypothetical protein